MIVPALLNALPFIPCLLLPRRSFPASRKPALHSLPFLMPCPSFPASRNPAPHSLPLAAPPFIPCLPQPCPSFPASRNPALHSLPLAAPPFIPCLPQPCPSFPASSCNPALHSLPLAAPPFIPCLLLPRHSLLAGRAPTHYMALYSSSSSSLSHASGTTAWGELKASRATASCTVTFFSRSANNTARPLLYRCSCCRAACDAGWRAPKLLHSGTAMPAACRAAQRCAVRSHAAWMAACCCCRNARQRLRSSSSKHTSSEARANSLVCARSRVISCSRVAAAGEGAPPALTSPSQGYTPLQMTSAAQKKSVGWVG